MMMLSKNKKILLIASIAVLVIGLLAFIYLPVIFQEGNPWPQIKGISQLTFGGSDMVKLSGSDNMYLTKTHGGSTAIDAFMKDKGYEFTDQMGSGYFYKSADKTIVITRRQYSRFYTIWTIIENQIKLFNELELRECLAENNTPSQEKCRELLKQITDYDSCVKAGFPIMKSNPPQCAAPDGRIFIENKK